MTDDEFSALTEGDSFERSGKVYVVLKPQGTHVISRETGNHQLHVHFLPQQASQMTKIEPEPPSPARRKSSHGFPLIERSKPRLPQPHMSAQSTPSICIALDGGLAEARRGNEIGTPIAEGLEFLADVAAAGIDVQISTHRPQSVVWEWLRVHCPGMENIAHVSPQPPPPGMPYLSRYAYRIDDTYPTVEELSALMQPSEENAPTVESAFGR
jgi:hypothetical protein